MTCVNCSEDSAYYLNDPGANPLHYCARCLPRHLADRAAAGHFPLPTPAPAAAKRRT